MDLSVLWFLLLVVLLVALRLHCVPKRIPAIPYNKFSYVVPWGDLAGLGISYFAKGEVFRWFSSQSQAHRSGIFQLFLPSFSMTSPVVVVTDQNEVKDIVTRRVGAIDRSHLMRLWFGLLCPQASIGMPTNREFKAIRWAWNHALNPSFLGTVAAPRARDAAMALAELWSLKADKERGAAFEAGEDLRRTTLEAMIDTLLGRKLGVVEVDIHLHRSLGEENKQTWWSRRDHGKRPDYPRFYQDFRLCMVCMDWVTTGASATAYLWFFRRLFRPFQKAQTYVEACLQQVIEDARQKSYMHERIGQLPDSALELVIGKAGSRSQAEDAVSDAGLMSELMELLVAGHESTSSALGWALKHLADYQIAQETLFQHLVAALLGFPGTLPTSEQIITTPIPYLDATISETLRLSCTGPVSFREAKQDCTILGYRVPSGTPIMLMTQDVTHKGTPSKSRGLDSLTSGKTFLEKDHVRRDDEPLDQFHPERWLTPAGEYDPQAILSMPFSAGARGCYGSKFALMEMRIMLVVLVWNFRFAKLDARLSQYSSIDGLTRLPNCCNVLPVLRQGRRVEMQDERSSSSLPALG